jgi:hypothetical protein
MMADRTEQKLMIDGVKEPFDVHVQDPVEAPTSLTRRPDGIDGGAFGPIPIGIPALLQTFPGGVILCPVAE